MFLSFLLKLSQRGGLVEYPKEISCAHVEQIFGQAADFVARPMKLGDVSVTAFFIDGLTSGSEIAEYVLQPISQVLHGTEEELYEQFIDACWKIEGKGFQDLTTQAKLDLL